MGYSATPPANGPFSLAPGGYWDTEDDLHVGTPTSPAEMWIGGGGPLDEDQMQVWSEDGGGTFADISANNAGDTLAFPALTANNAIYVAGRADPATAIQLLGMQLDVVTAMVLGAGSVAIEYWNGAWTDFATMTTDRNPPLLPFGDAWLEQTGAKNIRLNQAITADWALSDPMAAGQTEYWMRFRIVTTITTGPVFGSIGGILDSLKINSNAFQEFFGLARARMELNWDIGLLSPASSSPANQDVYLSDTLDVGRVENQFNNGVVDRIAFVSKIPQNLCTSCAMRFGFNWQVDGVSAGNVQWTIRWALYTDGDNVYETAGAAPVSAPGQQSLVQTIAAPVVVSLPISTFFLLDVREAIASRPGGAPPDGIWISLERDGGADSNTDSAIVVQVAGDYVAWSVGGYIGS